MTLHHKRNGQVLFHNINQNHSTAASANLCLQKTNKRVITFTIGNFTISKIAQTSQSNEDRFWISAFILISSPGTNPILSRWMVPETGPDLQHRQHIRLDPLLVVECCKRIKHGERKMRNYLSGSRFHLLSALCEKRAVILAKKITS